MKLTLKSDYSFVPEVGGVVHLLAEAQAPVVEIKSRKRPSLNLAIVIDASGSMQGAPLEAAKRASIGVVEAMREEDRLSIVSFASEVITHFDGEICNQDGKRRCVEEISRLESRDCTDLAGGWLAGARAVARLMDELKSSQNHVVLLSDGHANEGIIDPRILAEQAAELRQRNLFTSTVGIGDDYSPVQLQALAEHGGGRMHDAERPEEIIEVVLAELGEMRRTVAEGVELRVVLPEGIEAECLGSYPLRRSKRTFRLHLGGLNSGASRQVLMRFRVPASTEAYEWTLNANASWKRPGESVREIGDTVFLTIRYRDLFQDAPHKRDESVAAQVAALWQSWLVGRAMAANVEGRYEEAESIVRGELEAFDKYVVNLPEGRRLLHELRRFVHEVNTEWSPRATKEVLLHHSKIMRDEADHRSLKREDWADFIGRK